MDLDSPRNHLMGHHAPSSRSEYAQCAVLSSAIWALRSGIHDPSNEPARQGTRKIPTMRDGPAPEGVTIGDLVPFCVI